ncbi:MAG: hypothetical protein ACYCW6_07085 [Candidatus Xenobia bacterium]
MTLQRTLREKARLQRQRRLMRDAYLPVWQRIRSNMPIVFALQGNLQVFANDDATTDRLRSSGAVFTLESAARMRYNCKLINTDDVFAYLDHPVPFGPPLPEEPPGLQVGARPPRAFVVVGESLPAFETMPDGTRVVLPDRLLMEYVGFFGHRFDLLAALCACIDRTASVNP